MNKDDIHERQERQESQERAQQDEAWKTKQKALADEAIKCATVALSDPNNPATISAREYYGAEQPAPVQQEPVTDEENEKFSRDVSNFKGTDEAATMYALEKFLKGRMAAQPAPVQQEQCPTCGEFEPRTGTCGTSPNDKLALCNRNAPQPAQQTCNCRWEGDVQVQECTLHQSHLIAIHEWAGRAKAAEAKLAAQPAQRKPLTEKEVLECRSVNHLYFYKAVEAKLREKNT